VSEVEQRPDAVVLAEGRPPRLEERLGGDHEDFHENCREIVRTVAGVVNVSLAAVAG
jgi:hypothetical protein